MPINGIDNLEWLEAWYQRQCDGVWEHELGLNLRPVQPEPRPQPPPSRSLNQPAQLSHTLSHTLSHNKDRQDDPSASVTPVTNGWGLTIELAGTDAADRQPRTLVLDSQDGDWLSCAMTPDRFEGTGDARRLEQIIGVFRHWVDSPASIHIVPLEATSGD